MNGANKYPRILWAPKVALVLVGTITVTFWNSLRRVLKLEPDLRSSIWQFPDPTYDAQSLVT